MSDVESDDTEIDAFLDSDESVEDLLKEEYGPRESNDEFFKDLQPDDDFSEEEIEVSASPDERLIKGKGIALTSLDTEGVTLDEDISKEEETVATHAQDEFANPALNSVYKATMNERAIRERKNLNKREMLDLAADVVDEYFRKHVQTDGVDDAKLNELKFAARKRVARTLAEE